MNYEDLTPEQKEIWDIAFQAGVEAEDNDDAWNVAYNEGFNDGEEEGYNDGFHSGKEEGIAEGAKLEQERIQSVLQMMFEASLNMGHGNKAIQYRHAMELLTPINYKYDEAKYYEDLRNDGF